MIDLIFTTKSYGDYKANMDDFSDLLSVQFITVCSEEQHPSAICCLNCRHSFTYIIITSALCPE